MPKYAAGDLGTPPPFLPPLASNSAHVRACREVAFEEREHYLHSGNSVSSIKALEPSISVLMFTVLSHVLEGDHLCRQITASTCI